MSLLPVIIRELRAQARQPLTYWLRVIGGLSVVFALAMAMWTLSRFESGLPGAKPLAASAQVFGTTLFGKVNLAIFIAIWVFVPLATADAISRERRERTLPLLFLTELGSIGIVVGKAFVHLLRSTCLLAAMIPWLMLALIFGGVGLKDVAMALLLDLASVLLAQAAGLLASTIPRDWLKSVLLAEAFAVMLLLSTLWVHGAVLGRAVRLSAPAGLNPGTRGFWNSPFSTFWEFYPSPGNGRGLIERASRLVELTTNASVRENGRWSRRWGGSMTVETEWQHFWATLPPAGQTSWFRGAAGMVAGAALVLLAATFIGAWQVERSWRDAPGQVRAEGLRRRFFLPRFCVDFLKRGLSRSLSANPIAWLHQYSLSARMVKWGWCLGILAAEIVFSQNPADAYAAQPGIGLLLLLALAFSATGSFREELETGAFELLLSTPLRERQIIVGRVRGLWRQFFPAMCCYVVGNICLGSGWHDQEHSQQAWLIVIRTVTAYCCLPWIGLYFSVQRLNFFLSWLATSLIGLLPAAALGWILGAPEISILLQVGAAIASAVGLERRLRNRDMCRKPA